MRFHVLVTPYPNEPLVIDQAHARAGLEWLRAQEQAGVLVAVEAFPQTGGYMIIETESRVALDDLLGTYPLRTTVAMNIHELVPLDAGFDVLLTAIDEHRRVDA